VQRLRSPFLNSCAAVLLAGGALLAQNTSLGLRVQLPDSTNDVADGSLLLMPTTAIGQTVGGNFNATNRTTQTITINFIQVSGSTDFTLGNAPETPFTVPANGVFGFQVNYKATTSQRTNGRLQINFTAGTASFTFGVNLTGVCPEFAFSFIPSGGNQTVLTDGATIQFPNTAIDASSSAAIVATNRGSYQGVFNFATVSGSSEFATFNVPLSGTVVEAGREIRFGLNFTPKTLDPSRGTLTIETGDRRISANLAGLGSGARFAYETVSEAGSAPLSPNTQITIPDTNVSEKTTAVVRVRNTGNADGRITALSVNGSGFSLADPPILPVLLPQNSSIAVTINFQPTTPGRATGRLRIGSDDFDLVSNGLGPNLTYAFVINNVSTPVANNGSVIFTPAAVGASSSLRFQITNTGTAPTTVSSIGFAAPTTVFTLGALPNLPVNLAPNASTGFTISFSPVALGTTTATLRVDNLSFTLSGAGNAPPPLPAIRFDGASGNQDPLAQPAVGLTLASSYPLALSGTLTLTFNSEVGANDPAVQFATGGRTVAFTIPANTSRAIFPNNATQIRVQTGSVAGSIVLTPDVVTADGGIRLTPTNPPTASLSVAAGAPRLLSVSVSSKTANTVTLLVSGYATSRSVTGMQLTITPTQGENVQTTSLTLPVEAAFVGYYAGAASAQFGSLFSATIPLTLAGDLTNVTQLADTIQSVSVTATNRVGTSPAVSVNVR